MFIRMVSVTVNPDHLQEIRDLCSSEEVNGVLKNLEGFLFRDLLESEDNPNEIVSITGWNNKSNTEEYEQSGTYDSLKEKFVHFFTSTPSLKSYEVNSFF